MPIQVLGASTSGETKFAPRDLGDLALQERFQYDYPEGLDLTPGSRLHNEIRDFVMLRAYDSSNHIRGRHDAWASLDQKLTVYIPLDKRELAIREKDKRKPTSIVLPVSYATLETFLTFLVAAFLDDFLFRYEGVGPEDVVGAMKLQHLMNYQFINGDMGLNLHTMWRDSLVYNFGGIAVEWDVKTRASRNRELAESFGALKELGIDVNDIDGAPEFVEKIVYEGNRLTNMDPYYTLPYPHKPVYATQDAEWFGWIKQTNYTELLQDEELTDNYFNVRYLQRVDGRSALSMVKTGRTDKTGLADRDSQPYYGSTRPIDVIDMFADIAPSQMGLGDSDRLERWLFSVAGDNIVIQAAPMGLIHNMAPMVVCSPTSDGHSMLDVSVLEIGEGMAEFFTFIVNSRMANIRSAMNLGLVYDPKLINFNDFSTSDAGFRARLNHAAWGLGLADKAIKQLDIRDVTAGHVGDAFSILDMNNRFLGTVDALQGVVRSGGERVTAEEISNTFRSALSRLEKTGRLISMQAHVPLARILAFNTQELMTQGTYVKLLGDLGAELQAELGDDEVQRGRVAVSPEELDVDFNIIAHDGSIPSGGGNVREWVDLIINFMAKTPVGSQLDFDRLFLSLARRMGEKNAHKFLKSSGSRPVPDVEVKEDQDVERQAQAGNLVPAEEFAGATNGFV